jgi:hypothetical protein
MIFELFQLASLARPDMVDVTMCSAGRRKEHDSEAGNATRQSLLAKPPRRCPILAASLVGMPPLLF